MKRWEYLYVSFIESYVATINGLQAAGFEYATNWTPVKGEIWSRDFIEKAGKDGWEAITMDGNYRIGHIFFKRELINKKKRD